MHRAVSSGKKAAQTDAPRFHARNHRGIVIAAVANNRIPRASSPLPVIFRRDQQFYYSGSRSFIDLAISS
jgi:hypothetical protein